MQQYFIQGIIDQKQPVMLDEEQLHHMLRVLKMKPHDQICLVDEAENVWLAELMNDEKWYASIIEQMPSVNSAISIHLAPALIKGERWDYLLQKCSELGVNEISGFLANRCVVKWKQAEKEKKLKRWNKITQEACEQCRRSDLVHVHEPMTLKQLCEAKADLKLVAYERSDSESEHILSLLHEHPHIKSVLAVIGPEGGFEPWEAAQLMQAGFHCVSLGKRILRAETAAISIVNVLSMYYEYEIRGVTNEKYRGNPQ